MFEISASTCMSRHADSDSDTRFHAHVCVGDAVGEGGGGVLQPAVVNILKVSRPAYFCSICQRLCETVTAPTQVLDASQVPM